MCGCLDVQYFVDREADAVRKTLKLLRRKLPPKNFFGFTKIFVTRYTDVCYTHEIQIPTKER